MSGFYCFLFNQSRTYLEICYLIGMCRGIIREIQPRILQVYLKNRRNHRFDESRYTLLIGKGDTTQMLLPLYSL